MAEAANLLSSSSYPTMGDLHMIFPITLKILNDVCENDSATPSIKSRIAQRMYDKLNDYWSIHQRLLSYISCLGSKYCHHLIMKKQKEYVH